MTNETTALVPIQEKQVDFYGDEVTAVLVDADGESEVYVPVRPLCQFLGIDWPSQYQRIKRDPVLSEALRLIVVTTNNPQGGNPNTAALPLDYLHGWLFGINAARVKPELRDKLIRYQRECYRALARAFQVESLATRPRTATADTAILIQVRETALAVAALADQQLALQLHQADTDARLDRAAEVVRNLAGRVGTIERKLAAGPITEEQAAEIAARVKALAEYLTSRQPGQVHYQAIYSELYRRFGVSGYKSIRIDQYEAVLAFLEDWRRAAT